LKYICGQELYADFIVASHRVGQLMINDPIVARLWLILLFLSAPLDCYYDCSLSEQSSTSLKTIFSMQNLFATLLWKYLTHRYSQQDAIRIFSNLNRIYLHIQSISHAIHCEIRTRDDLIGLKQAFARAVMIHSDA
jgi:hypothetical protein